MHTYMREQFPFLGIKTPERRALTKTVLQAYDKLDGDTLRASAEELWALPEREYQYAALDMLFKYAKTLTCADMPRLEHFILTKSWWDTVDALAKLVGEVFSRDQACRDIWLPKWRRSESLWLRRSAILFQLAYKGDTDAELLFALVKENAASREFFIQKASGWALREYAKTDRERVQAFVAASDLPALTRREACKHR